MSRHSRFGALALAAVAIILTRCSQPDRTVTQTPQANAKTDPDPAVVLDQLKQQRPVAIMWQAPGMAPPERNRSFLRLAVFKDGTVLFNANQDQWTDELRLGRTSEVAVVRMMESIRATGVGDLKQKFFWPPDATTTVIRLRLGTAPFNLEWDHRDYHDSENYAEFRRAWDEVTKILASTVPTESRPVGQAMRELPVDWLRR
jgi:hypothetical protein